MNAIFRIIWIFVFVVFSMAVFANQAIHANKITVTGYPVILDDRGGVYFVPNSYVTSTEANFVTLEHVKHVCYVLPQPKLSVLNNQLINVDIKGARIQWTCYRYDENYFIFSP